MPFPPPSLPGEGRGKNALNQTRGDARMKQVARIFPMACLILLLTGAVAMAAASTNLKATGTASGQTTLVWTFQTGDAIHYSLDGLTWNTVAAPGGGGVQAANGDAVDGNTRVIGLEDFRNYYFRIGLGGTYSNVVDAFPPDEHAHRYFAADTNQCAKCHNTHTGAGEKLLKTDTVNATCKTCHAGGTGSKYQVDFGTVKGPNGTTLTAPGGLFGTNFRSGAGVPTPTSAHPFGRLIAYAPGGDRNDTNGLWNEPLGCGSCHSAHSDTTYQYRLLKTNLPNMVRSGDGTLSTLKVEAYAKTSTGKEDAVYVAGMNDFCGGCHADYNTTAINGSGHSQSGIYLTALYRHAVGKDISSYNGSALTTNLPLEAGAAAFLSDGTPHSAGKVFCLTCHRPHGVTTTGNLALLRMNSRGVCQDCHQK